MRSTHQLFRVEVEIICVFFIRLHSFIALFFTIIMRMKNEDSVKEWYRLFEIYPPIKKTATVFVAVFADFIIFFVARVALHDVAPCALLRALLVEEQWHMILPNSLQRGV